MRGSTSTLRPCGGSGNRERIRRNPRWAELLHTLTNASPLPYTPRKLMPSRAFDFALFDLDGTVADTLPLIYEAFDAAFIPALGSGFSPDEIRAMFGPPDHQIIRSR